MRGLRHSRSFDADTTDVGRVTFDATPVVVDTEDIDTVDSSVEAQTSAARDVARFIVSALIVALLGGVVYLWPASLGGRSTVVFVTGTSMVPTLTSDDVVLAREHANYAIGDLVVFRVPEGDAEGAYVIHRIIGGSADTGWVTQGDNRSTADPWLVSASDVVGLAERKAGVGALLRTTFDWLLAPIVWSVAAMVVVFVVVLRYLRERDDALERDHQHRSATNNVSGRHSEFNLPSRG